MFTTFGTIYMSEQTQITLNCYEHQTLKLI